MMKKDFIFKKQRLSIEPPTAVYFKDILSLNQFNANLNRQPVSI
ncbi:hypothetical protein SAMN05421690_102426 [Nitrosomonas sp. Nm51]|nr:hypothetical protein SAMN05421690_102426 [Nitrosomonas sp. Nm51]